MLERASAGAGECGRSADACRWAVATSIIDLERSCHRMVGVSVGPPLVVRLANAFLCRTVPLPSRECFEIDTKCVCMGKTHVALDIVLVSVNSVQDTSGMAGSTVYKGIRIRSSSAKRKTKSPSCRARDKL